MSIPLETKAVVQSPNWGPVHRESAELRAESLGFVLRMGSAGSYYLTTLLGLGSTYPRKQFKQKGGRVCVPNEFAGMHGFKVLNMHELLEEALDLIQDFAADYVKGDG